MQSPNTGARAEAVRRWGGARAWWERWRAGLAYRRVVALQRSGRLEEAQRLCERIVADDPGHGEALHWLGVTAARQGRLEEAQRLLAAAVASAPGRAEVHANHANVLKLLGRTEAALASCERALALKPELVVALNLRGALLQEMGRREEALSSFEAVLARDAGHAEALYRRGCVLRELGRPEEALSSFERALAQEPQWVEAHNARGLLLKELKRFDEALASFERALAVKADFVEAQNNRGAVLKELKRYEEALVCFERALEHKPDLVEALSNRGAVLKELKRYEEALVSLDRALALKPEFAGAHNNRGITLRALKRNSEALAALERALVLDRDFVEALTNRGTVLKDMKRSAEALASFDRALALDPDCVEALQSRGHLLADLGRHEGAIGDFERVLALDAQRAPVRAALLYSKMSACDWRGYEAAREAVIADVRQGKHAINPFTFLGISDSPADQLLCSRTWVREEAPAAPVPLWNGERYRHDRIRIAYLSADYRDHATSYLIAGLLERHDRARFEITAVAFGPDARDAMRARVQSAVEHFVDVREHDDRAVAALMRAREIDIAVDLGGFTTHCRTGILASRPAPIQVSYLGFPGTMAAEYIDYLIADSVVLPPDEQAWFTERVVYLPDSYQVNDSKRQIATRTPSRAEAGLPQAGFVFCSFNNSYKVNPPMFDVWMRLLRAVDGSVLWLLAPNPAVPDNLRREAAARGVAPWRIVFAPKIAHADHLARHRLADLFLDSLPYNAHTTTSDALWAGLPVVTSIGSAFPGRVAASLLQAAGLPELVTRSLAEYEALALELARDREKLAELKAKLAQNRDRCALFDTDRFRRHIEAAYAGMWERWQRGEQPAPFTVAPRD